MPELFLEAQKACVARKTSPVCLACPDFFQVVALFVQQVLKGQLSRIKLRFGLRCQLSDLQVQ